jgi:pimeloyl-ACP methyl ester carboxylesterase
LGFSEGCSMSALFAATYPERVSKLLLFGGFAVATSLPGDVEQRLAQRINRWGTGDMSS